jgi:integrase/recombinase XerD
MEAKRKIRLNTMQIIAIGFVVIILIGALLLSLPAASKDNTVLYLQGKGREEKTEFTKLPEAAEKAIRSYLKARQATDPTEPLFTSLSNNSKGERLSTRAISGLVKEKLIIAGYDSPRLTAHSLRHTAVTLSILAGKELSEVQQFARHADINTTMIYNHSLEMAKNGCSEAVAALLFD